MSGGRVPGRRGAIDAIVEASRALFAEHGPNGVSLRDIARRAGVNLGLIHHYIGSRDDLLRLVFSVSMEQARDGVADAGDVRSALAALRGMGKGATSTRLLAWALLEGRDPADFHGRSSALDAIVAAGGDDSREVRVALAVAMVQSLGWKLFGDYVVAAAGLGDDPDGARQEADALVDALVERSAAGDRSTA